MIEKEDSYHKLELEVVDWKRTFIPLAWVGSGWSQKENWKLKCTCKVKKYLSNPGWNIWKSKTT